MTREEALRYWGWHLERAEEWSDPHWEASERKAHKEYVDAMKMAIEALKEADRSEPGQWEVKPYTDEYGLKRPKLVCSKCKKEPAAWDLTELFNYCPNCGKAMNAR